MQFLRWLPLSLALLGSVHAQDLMRPRFLFDYVPGETTYGMVDIATCLEIQTPSVGDVDAGRWVAIVVLSRQNRVPSCAQCYTHIDGANIIGVLPIIKDTLREPFLVHSSRFENHGVPWFWTPSRPGYSAAVNILDPLSATTFLSNLTNQVTAETLQSFVTASSQKFSYPLTAGGATGKGPESLVLLPYTQGITKNGATLPGSIFGGSYLTVPDTIEDLPTNLDGSSAGAVPYPLPAFLFPGGSLNAGSGQVATGTAIELQNRSARSLLQASNLTAGSLVRRTDPVLTPEQQSPGTENYARMFWPAKEFYEQAAFASVEMATDLQLCGVDYLVKEYGSVHPDVLASLRAATDAQSATPPAGAFWVTNTNVGVSDGGRASFNALTGYWTGK